MNHEQFSKHDIDEAKQRGQIIASLEALHSKFDNLKAEKKDDHQAIWMGIEKVRERQDEQDKAISNQNGVIKGVVAAGALIQALVMVFIGWFKHN